jgi:hypothetical protein
LNSQFALAPKTISLSGSEPLTFTCPVARHAIEKRLGSVANPSDPLMPPVSARDM